MADLAKAFKILGVDVSKVITPGEVASLSKMPAKKAAPMIEDVLKKAHKVAKAEAVMKALKDSGFA